MKKQLTHVDLQRMCFALGGDYKTIHIANDHIHDLDNLLTENEAMVTVGTWMAPFEYERAKTFTKMFTSTGIDGGHQVIALTGACTFAYRPTHFYCISVVLPKRDVYLSELPNILGLNGIISYGWHANAAQHFTFLLPVCLGQIPSLSFSSCIANPEQGIVGLSAIFSRI